MKKSTFFLLTTLTLVFSSQELYADRGDDDRHRHKTYRTRIHYGRHDNATQVVTTSRVIHRHKAHRYVTGSRAYLRGYDREQRHHDNHVSGLLIGLAIALPLILPEDHRHGHGRHAGGGRYGRGYRH